MHPLPTLFYIHDPMCSWCYGFKPVLTKIENALKKQVKIQYLLGGLAEDTDLTMPIHMQQQIQSNWHRIEQTIPGITFNYNFWTSCVPKRSTYPSCRAVIAANKQRPTKEKQMIDAIQQAYYQQAKNPSNISVLNKLALDIGLNQEQFKNDIDSEDTHKVLTDQIAYSRKLGVQSYPSLMLLKNSISYPIALDYNHAEITFDHIISLL